MCSVHFLTRFTDTVLPNDHVGELCADKDESHPVSCRVTQTLALAGFVIICCALCVLNIIWGPFLNMEMERQPTQPTQNNQPHTLSTVSLKGFADGIVKFEERCFEWLLLLLLLWVENISSAQRIHQTSLCLV